MIMMVLEYDFVDHIDTGYPDGSRLFCLMLILGIPGAGFFSHLYPWIYTSVLGIMMFTWGA